MVRNFGGRVLGCIEADLCDRQFIRRIFQALQDLRASARLESTSAPLDTQTNQQNVGGLQATFAKSLQELQHLAKLDNLVI